MFSNTHCTPYSSCSRKAHHLELQLSDRAQDQIVIAQRPEQLRRALLAQLIQPLAQRLRAQRILQHGAAKDLGREIGDAGEVQHLTLR